MSKERAPLIAIAAAVVLVIAVACASLPIPLPFQAQAVASPAAGGQAATAKPGAQAGAKPGGGAGVPVVTTPATVGRVANILTVSGGVTAIQQTNLVPKASGRLEKILVEVGESVKAGQVLVQLDRGTLDSTVKQAEANILSAQARVTTVTGPPRKEDVTSAEAAVQSAEARLRIVKRGALPSDMRSAEQSVEAAQAAYNRAVADYEKLSKPSVDELASAKALVERTKAALQTAQTNYDKVGWRSDVSSRPEAAALQIATADYESARASLRIRESPRSEDLAASLQSMMSARAQLEATQTRLDQLRAGATSDDVQIADATLTQARQALGKTTTPFTESDVATARAQLAQAQAQLEIAKTNALEATVVAPYDGVIVARPVSEGSLVSAQTTALVLASSSVEIVLNIDEARVGQVRVGQAASLIVPAYPGKAFPAKVVSIAPAADARTHTFPVRVRPDPAAADLRPGMFAEVRIVTAEKERAIVVPRDAVTQRGGKPVLFVVQDGRVKQLDAGNGFGDEKTIEIPTGLNEGDQVVIAGQATVNDGDAVRVDTGRAQGGAQAGRPAGAGEKPGAGEGQKPQNADTAKPATGDGVKPTGASDKQFRKPDGAAPAKP
ncbi:MAG: efflux RND transporter periplasmic adaptor subunit [Chloroflexota bacterium]|nr:MAG: efflux RND transporter periplasmic adaptor subunit [Chloroflexota bacterium]